MEEETNRAMKPRCSLCRKRKPVDPVTVQEVPNGPVVYFLVCEDCQKTQSLAPDAQLDEEDIAPVTAPDEEE